MIKNRTIWALKSRKSILFLIFCLMIIVLILGSNIKDNSSKPNDELDITPGHNDETPYSSSPLPTGTRGTDGDGLPDDQEILFGTNPNDKDSDDDGVWDGDEGLYVTDVGNKANDPDNDGLNNALDPDSDNDGILDGTESGVTDADLDMSHTILGTGHFYADQDPTTTTDMTKWDTDGDTISDGDEDSNHNGKLDVDRDETDPNFKDFDNDLIHDDEDTDDDNDGMPDIFEETYRNALDPLDPTDAGEDDDYDDDGFSNYQEYLGDDGLPGNSDWSNPENPESKPNMAPVIKFRSDDEVDVGGVKTKRVEYEAKQKIVFNDTLLYVYDEYQSLGLRYDWDFGDGTQVITMHDVKPGDAPMSHIYSTSGTYILKLEVKDNKDLIGVGKLVVDMIPHGDRADAVVEIPRGKEEFKDRYTIQRQGWIAYKLLDVRAGDTITIDFKVQEETATSNIGLRIIIIPETNFDIYRINNPTKNKISREYQDYWSGELNDVKKKGKIVIKAEKDDTIYVITDNRFYEESKDQIKFDEPVEFKINIHRQEPFFGQYENWLYLLIPIIIFIIVILAPIGYSKMRHNKLIKPKK